MALELTSCAAQQALGKSRNVIVTQAMLSI